VRLFGQVEVVVDGEPFRLATPRKSLQVLAYLLLNRAAAVSRDYLAFLIWPDDEEDSARAKLRATISDLQRVLPQPARDFVHVETDTLAWNPDVEVSLDVDAFVAASRDRSHLEEAIDLYRGDLLPELYDEWLYAVRERYRNTYLTCLAELVSATRKKGDFGRAIEIARKVLAVDPWREDIVRRIMAMRYEAGDRAGALSEYVHFSERLSTEMGIQPMAETASVVERIVQGQAVEDEDVGGAQVDAAQAALRPDEQAPLFGRSRELERLTEAWSRAKQGRGSVVFLGGEPGIGKSRLALELARAIEEDGGRVLVGATGAPESFPYQAIVEALRAGLPLVAELSLGQTWFAALAGLLPELPQRVGPLPQLPTIDAEQQRLRLFEALGRAFVALSKPRPLFVLLEDVHWASQATFDALGFMARRTVGARVLIVVTFRDDEAHRRHPLRRLQREAEFQGAATMVSLSPLDLGAVTEIVRHVPRPDDDAATFGASMYAMSGGNPLFLSQLLAAPEHMLSGRVPPTITSLVGARIVALSEAARTVAEIAALVGQRFAVEIVRDVSGWDDAAVLGAMDELLDRRIVRETSGRGIFRYAFAHLLVQQAIRDACDADGVRERSRRIARVLGELYPERSDELAADIARHLEQGGEPADAAAHYLVAARRALELGALDDSRSDATRGLRLATDRGTIRELLLVRETVNTRRADTAAQSADLDALSAMADEADDDDLRCRVLLRRGTLAVLNGCAEASSILAELQDRARRTGNLKWQADADFNQSLLLDLNLSVEDGIRVARRARTAYAHIGDDAGSANALAVLAHTLSAAGDGVEARTSIDEALVVAERSGNYGARVRALRIAAGVAVDAGDHERAAEVSHRWLDLAIAAGDRREEAVALVQSAWSLADSPRFVRALPALARAEAIAREWNLPRIRAMVAANAAEIWTKLGAFSKAVALLEEAIELHMLGSTVNTASAKSDLALALAHDGQVESAALVARTALSGLESVGNTTGLASVLENLAEAEWRCGRRRSAIDQFESALELRRSASVRLSIAKDTALLAVLHAEMHDLDRARFWAGQVPEDQASFKTDGLWPQRSAWAAAYAYHACGEEALAAAWLGRGRAIFEEHVAQLDEEQRETFGALAWHRNMLAACAAHWPAHFW
jgi:DNA-binding SARP family transcriptional activator